MMSLFNSLGFKYWWKTSILGDKKRIWMYVGNSGSEKDRALDKAIQETGLN